MKAAIILLALFGIVLATASCDLQNIETNSPEMTDTEIRSCIQSQLRSGTLSISNINPNSLEEYKPLLVKAIQEQITRLKIISQQIIVGLSLVEPVLKWGQNISHIFVTAKTSHRWDSPPCLNTKSQSSFLNESHFSYINVCLVSHQKINFQIKFRFYEQVVVRGDKGPLGEQLSFKMISDGVGTYSAIIEKLQNKIWPFLSKERKNYPVWEQIAQRYESDFKQYETIMSEIIAKDNRAKQKKNQHYLTLAVALLILLTL